MKIIKPSFEVQTEIDGEKILKKLELAARTCYKSEDKITVDSAKKILAGLLKVNHHSVIEHENITVKFITDRGILAELTRHRLCSFSVESTRYVNYKEGITVILPPWVDIDPGIYDINCPKFKDYADMIWFKHMVDCEENYQELIKQGYKPQQARSILPNSLKNEIVMTTNIREWRHIFNLRCTNVAHPQMRELLLPLLKYFHEKIPLLFDDIYDKYKDNID